MLWEHMQIVGWSVRLELNSYQTSSLFFRILAGILSVLAFFVSVEIIFFGPFRNDSVFFNVLVGANIFYFSLGLGFIAVKKRFWFFNFVDNGKQIASIFRKKVEEKSK